MQDFFIHQTKNQSLTVGGVSTLVDFTDDAITVRVKNGLVTVKGVHLIIERFDENEMVINGRICEALTYVTR